MKLLIALVSAVYVLSMVYQVELSVVFICQPGDEIDVEVNTTVHPNLRDYYVTVANTTQCNTSNHVQLMNSTMDPYIQIATITCYNYTINESLVVAFTENDTFVVDADSLVTYDLTCQLPENRTLVYDNITVTGNPTTAIVEGIYQPNYTTNNANPVVAVRENIAITLTLTDDTATDVFVALQSVYYQVTGSSMNVPLVVDKCPINDPVNVSITGTPDDGPATALTFKAAAFGVTDAQTSTAFVVIIRLTYIFCPVENPSACYQNDTCPDGTDQIGRKRRQDVAGLPDDVIVREAQETLVVFPSDELKQAYVDQLVAEAGLSMQPTGPKEGEVCVNKTVTGVLLALLLIAMALCLISSVIMFMKLRKNRQDKLVTPDHSYSNKGF